MACASHGGSDAHVERRARDPRRRRPQRGTTSPAARPSRATRPRRSRSAVPASSPRSIRHNCSGKHAFGLAFAAAEGWPTEGYIDKGHPLQDAMEGGMAEATRVRPGELTRATDGCGMRTFSVPIARLAAAFGRLASGGLGPAGERLTAAMTRPPAARRLRRRDRHRADARPPAAGLQDRRRGRARHRPARRPRRRAQGARRRHPRARRRRAAAARGALGDRGRRRRARRAAGGAGATTRAASASAAPRRRSPRDRRRRDRPRHGRAGPGAQPHRRRAAGARAARRAAPPRSASTPSCTSTTSPPCAPTRTTRARRRRATSCSGSTRHAARHAPGPDAPRTATSTSSAPGTSRGATSRSPARSRTATCTAAARST